MIGLLGLAFVEILIYDMPCLQNSQRNGVSRIKHFALREPLLEFGQMPHTRPPP